MAFEHIPTLFEDSLDSVIGDLLDFTFPPIRYHPIVKHRPRFAAITDGHRFHPYLVNRGQRHASQGKEKFSVSLDVSHYKPKEITLKVEDGKLVVHGKHHRQSDDGFETSEFHRSYPLPDDVDQSTLTSDITPDGVLLVQANKKPSLQRQQQQDQLGTMLLSGGLTANDDTYTVSMATGGYKPEEIKVKVNGRQLVIEGRQESSEKGEHGDQVHQRQFYRSFMLPKDGEMDGVRSKLGSDGELVVTIPRNPALLPKEKVVPITMESAEERNKDNVDEKEEGEKKKEN